MPHSSAPLWQARPSAFWGSRGACVFNREPGSGRQVEKLMISSWGLILCRESSMHPTDKTTTPATSGSKQACTKHLLWCILNLIRNTAFAVIVEPYAFFFPAPSRWACYCGSLLDSFSSLFRHNSTSFDTPARGLLIKKLSGAAAA